MSTLLGLIKGEAVFYFVNSTISWTGSNVFSVVWDISGLLRQQICLINQLSCLIIKKKMM